MEATRPATFMSIKLFNRIITEGAGQLKWIIVLPYSLKGIVKSAPWVVHDHKPAMMEQVISPTAIKGPGQSVPCLFSGVLPVKSS